MSSHRHRTPARGRHRPPSRASRGAALASDERFDRLLPPDLRRLAARFFTPIDVAERAASLLVQRPGDQVLDVGSGVGKFCLVGAAHTDGIFVGVEQRPHLVAVARDLARTMAIDDVDFVHGDMIDVDWSAFDAFYLFNPFCEHAEPGADPLDRTVELSPAQFLFNIQIVRQRLAEARPGTRVATYHGYGGTMPAGYTCVVDEQLRTDRLKLWIKTDAAPASMKE